jgi:hypothetical protein
VPTFTCGLFLSNFSLAMIASDNGRPMGRAKLKNAKFTHLLSKLQITRRVDILLYLPFKIYRAPPPLMTMEL